MKNLHHTILAVAFWCSFSFVSLAQNGGEYVFSFLQLPASASESLNGGLQPAALQVQAAHSWHNPALSDTGSTPGLQLSYSNLWAGIQSVSAHMYVGKLWGAGISAHAFRLGYGNFTAASETGQITGSFTAADNALGISASYPLWDSGLRIGVGIHMLFAHYEQYSASALSSNIGLHYLSTNGSLAIGLQLRNWGVMLKSFSDKGREQLPISLELGAEKRLAHAPFSFSLALVNLLNWNLATAYTVADSPTQANYSYGSNSFGAEMLMHIQVGTKLHLGEFFEAGMSYRYKQRYDMLIAELGGTSGFTWGFGIKLTHLQVHFAYNSAHLTGGVQSLSVLYNW